MNHGSLAVVCGLLGCGTAAMPEPAAPKAPIPASSVPQDALSLYLAADGIRLNDQLVGDLASLEAELTNGQYQPLIEALPEDERPVWISAPGTTPWMTVRRMVISAADAGHVDRWLSADGKAFQMAGKPRARLQPYCKDGPVTVDGVARRMSVQLHVGVDGVWGQADVRFHPKINGVAQIGLPEACWSADCSLLGNRAAACAESRRAPSRISVGGATGCLLTIRKEIGDEERWAGELATVLKTLDWTADDEVSLQIEANVPWSATLAILDGFQRANLPQPNIGLPLVEGHDAPPPCSAEVTSSEALQTAAADWFGTQQR
ncbi:MAG: hypothetical protein GWP91_09885 [Rhodobacterales bacterium]|nr:hypothetical protein [Rhodobacterales bacterium]